MASIIGPENGNAAAMEYLASPAYESRVLDLMRRFHVPALTMAVIDGAEIHSKAFGLASIDPAEPCTPDTIFDVASTSKPLTALAVAILQHEGGFQWDTSMSSLLPEDFVMSTSEATETITVKDVLSHQTGLPGHDTSTLGVHAQQPDTPRTVVRNMRNLALSKPRSTYQYSNMMYTAATHLIETLTQSSFSDFLRHNVFEKLDMTSTFLQPSQVHAAGQGHRLSVPYTFANSDFQTVPRQETPEAQGAGSIHTNSTDFAKLLRAIMHRTGPITDSIYDSITTPRVMRNPKAKLEDFGPDSSEVAYGLGWDIKYYHGAQVVTHDGVIIGYGSRMFMLPEQKFGAFIAGNSDGAFDLSSVLQNELIDLVLGVPRDPKFDPKEKRLKRFEAQKARQEKNRMRNAERRQQAKATFTAALDDYCGVFYNAGYRHVKVQQKEGSLFIDGSDRSMPFTMPLEHVADNIKFRGYLTEVDGREDVLPVAFRVEGDQVPAAIGIAFEEALGDQLIWFDRV